MYFSWPILIINVLDLALYALLLAGFCAFVKTIARARRNRKLNQIIKRQR